MENDSPNPAPPPVPPPTYPASPPPPPARAVAPPKPRKGRGWIIAIIVVVAALGILAVSAVFSVMSGALGVFAGAGPAAMAGDVMLQEVTLENNRSSDKIAVIPVEGIIMGGALGGGNDLVHLIRDQLKLAGRDKRVKAVLLRVNSPGGEVLASDEIYSAIEKFQKEHKKPVVASMGSLAASGGYYVSAPCRWIVANELTITGSIGVIMHTYNYRGLMNKVGLRPVIFKSGRFKDMLSGEKDLEQLTPQEKADYAVEEAMIQKMITETFGRFKQVVGQGRAWANTQNQSNRGDSGGRKLATNWVNYADGRILSGKDAHEHGFVDELGDVQTAIKRARALANIESADLVTYQPPFDFSNLFSLFGKAETKSVKLDLGFDLPKIQSGLYYLAPAFLR